ncbi:uncharacterized protein LOC123401840 [Hordeum vulgare subsp. vulgare]|uniref:uncharacterized protein LOC123401840 n=1 Tax=Hordeum vulgare subsp. vulgare TaxID=112509 RepID=UPI001D1A5B2E|nr:uncharacterized protein LOC123401840 [Hordeum vulgare subsp. vulgare]
MRPDRGRPTHFGWWAPVTRAILTEVGAGAQLTRFAAATFPTYTSCQSRVRAVLTGSTTATSPSHCPRRRHHLTMDAGGSSSTAGQGGFHLMSCLKDVPTLRDDNYSEWRKKVDMAFVCAEVDWVLEEPQPVKPPEPVRDANDTHVVWEKKQRDYASVEMSYSFSNQKWVNTNKKCLTFIKNTIENAIVGSIAECPSAGKC